MPVINFFVHSRIPISLSFVSRSASISTVPVKKLVKLAPPTGSLKNRTTFPCKCSTCYSYHKSIHILHISHSQYYRRAVLPPYRNLKHSRKHVLVCTPVLQKIGLLLAWAEVANAVATPTTIRHASTSEKIVVFLFS